MITSCQTREPARPSIISLFRKFKLSIKDLFALSGSHSIGKARCVSIFFRLYSQSSTGWPDPALDPKFQVLLEKLCPLSRDENVTGNLDATPEVFDNQYFKDLVWGPGFLNSDQNLFTDAKTREFVRIFSGNQSEFFKAFVNRMIKMGDLDSGQPREIRRNCRGQEPARGDIVGGLKGREGKGREGKGRERETYVIRKFRAIDRIERPL